MNLADYFKKIRRTKTAFREVCSYVATDSSYIHIDAADGDHRESL